LTENPAAMAGKFQDRVRDRLNALVIERETSLRAVSQKIGRSPGYLNDFINKGSPTALDMADALAIAKVLAVKPAELGVEGIAVDNSHEMVASGSKPSLTFDYRERPALQKDLPIRGHTRAGKMGLFVDQGSHWGYAMRPESLRDAPDAYAVRVVDDSMYPRYAPGNVLAVDPHRRPQPGDNVVIQTGTEGEAFIKELVRRTEKVIICRQFNPPETVEFKAAHVRTIHMVVGIDYLER
jgi:phage repressor protein C with HTH and peptisase S24 domain